MGDAVACSVLVPVLNEERYIEQAVDAMRRQRFDGELEFIFADGGSSDRTREILERLAQEDPRIRVYDNPSRSVSSGLNVCLSHARGHWVARMDAHTVYPDDYIARGVARLREGGTRWVSGPQIPTGRGPVSRAVALALGGSLGRGGSRKWGVADRTEGAEYELDTGVFTGVWERATLLEYGGWDERWPRNSDSEMAARFLARGERLVCLPAMGGRYVPRDSLRGLWRQYVDYGEFRARTYRRHPHSMRASHLLAPAVVLTGAAALAGPPTLRAWARFGEALYLAALAAAGVRSRSAAERSADAALVPLVLFAMHHGHGVGQLRGWARYGPPLAAILRLAGTSGATGAPHGADAPVFAPSLVLRS
ncbi:MAG TPA: glycosyltransferase [Solirubrobacteraceae bacterium]|nr:glycosyltransferase [Solirubrobacteraceae bacterium]